MVFVGIAKIRFVLSCPCWAPFWKQVKSCVDVGAVRILTWWCYTKLRAGTRLATQNESALGHGIIRWPTDSLITITIQQRSVTSLHCALDLVFAFPLSCALTQGTTTGLSAIGAWALSKSIFLPRRARIAANCMAMMAITQVYAVPSWCFEEFFLCCREYTSIHLPSWWSQKARKQTDS